jgi:hypothetical protein
LPLGWLTWRGGLLWVLMAKPRPRSSLQGCGCE